MTREELIERAKRKETLVHIFEGPKKFTGSTIDGNPRRYSAIDHSGVICNHKLCPVDNWSLPEPKRLNNEEWNAVCAAGESLYCHDFNGRQHLYHFTGKKDPQGFWLARSPFTLDPKTLVVPFYEGDTRYWTRASETPSCVLDVVGSCSCGRCATGRCASQCRRPDGVVVQCERHSGHTDMHVSDDGDFAWTASSCAAESASPARYPGDSIRGPSPQEQAPYKTEKALPTATAVDGSSPDAVAVGPIDPYAEHNCLEEMRWQRGKPRPAPCTHCGCSSDQSYALDPALGYAVRVTMCRVCGKERP
jgi:hypothetical protein